MDDEVRILERGLAFFSSSLFFSAVIVAIFVSWFSIRNTVNSVYNEKLETLTSFTKIPSSIIQNLVATYKEEDGGLGSGGKDKQKKNSNDGDESSHGSFKRRNTFHNNKTAVGEERRDQVLRVNGTYSQTILHLKYSLSIGVIVCLLLGSYVSIVKTSHDNERTTAKLAVHFYRQTATSSIVEDLQKVISFSAEDRNSTVDKIHSTLSRLEVLHHALLFSNSTIGVSGDFGSGNSIDNLLTDDLCAAPYSFSCTSATQEVASLGLHAVYLQFMENVEILLSTIHTNTQGYNDPAYIATVNLEEGLLREGNAYVQSIIIDEITSTTDSEKGLQLALFVTMCVWTVLMYTLIFVPMMGVLREEVDQSKRIILMIPVEALIQVPRCLHILGINPIELGLEVKAEQTKEQKRDEQQQHVGSSLMILVDRAMDAIIGSRFLAMLNPATYRGALAHRNQMLVISLSSFTLFIYVLLMFVVKPDDFEYSNFSDMNGMYSVAGLEAALGVLTMHGPGTIIDAYLDMNGYDADVTSDISTLIQAFSMIPVVIYIVLVGVKLETVALRYGAIPSAATTALVSLYTSSSASPLVAHILLSTIALGTLVGHIIWTSANADVKPVNRISRGPLPTVNKLEIISTAVVVGVASGVEIRIGALCWFTLLTLYYSVTPSVSLPTCLLLSWINGLTFVAADKLIVLTWYSQEVSNLALFIVPWVAVVVLIIFHLTFALCGFYSASLTSEADDANPYALGASSKSAMRTAFKQAMGNIILATSAFGCLFLGKQLALNFLVDDEFGTSLASAVIITLSYAACAFLIQEGGHIRQRALLTNSDTEVVMS